ncbi:MAG TPA: hypothetical protein VL524_09765 [Gemmatimonadaceae bacterium]|jgi:hypothetical protein|nr:hypothetical protein [Gemmatimonadaceae bacterium]
MDAGSPLTPAQRDALRADARDTRERARAVAAESLRLRSNAKEQRMSADSRVTVSKDLRDRLRAMVVKHARLTRALGEPPEQAILEVKTLASAAVDDVRASVETVDTREAQALRDDLVRWTIDAYFGVGL